jgi:hypothetical protein
MIDISPIQFQQQQQQQVYGLISTTDNSETSLSTLASILNVAPNQTTTYTTPFVTLLPTINLTNQHQFSQIVKNGQLTPLLPNLIQFIASQVSTLQPLESTLTQMRTIYTLLFNPTINLEPYLTQILGILVSLLVSKQITTSQYTNSNGYYIDSMQPADVFYSPYSYLRQQPINMTSNNNTANQFAVNPPIRLLNTTPEPFVRQFIGCVLYQLIKQYSPTYPSILTRISTMLYTILSNFQQLIQQNNNYNSVTVLNNQDSTHSIPISYPSPSNQNINSHPSPVLHQSNSALQQQNNSKQTTLNEDDEVDLISSTMPAVLQQQRDLMTYQTTNPSLDNNHTQINAIQNSLLSLISPTITTFTTPIAPISHLSALLFLQNLHPSVILDQYSTTFATIFSYYSSLLYLPLPILNQYYNSPQHYYIQPPQKTYTTVNGTIYDLTSLSNNFSVPNQSSNHKLQQFNNISSSIKGVIQHLYQSTLILQLLNSLIKNVIYYAQLSHLPTLSLIKHYELSKQQQELINYNWIQQMRVKELNYESQQQHQKSTKQSQQHFQSNVVNSKIEKLNQKQFQKQFPISKKSTFGANPLFQRTKQHENQFRSNSKTSFETMFQDDEDANNHNQYEFEPTIISNTIQSYRSISHFNCLNFNQQDEFNQNGDQNVIGIGSSNDNIISTLTNLAPNLLPFPSPLAEFIPTPLAQPF